MLLPKDRTLAAHNCCKEVHRVSAAPSLMDRCQSDNAHLWSLRSHRMVHVPTTLLQALTQVDFLKSQHWRFKICLADHLEVHCNKPQKPPKNKNQLRQCNLLKKWWCKSCRNNKSSTNQSLLFRSKKNSVIFKNKHKKFLKKSSKKKLQSQSKLKLLSKWMKLSNKKVKS